jgi:hypothetical protein
MKWNVDVSQEQLEGFCRKWRITELSFFGSILRNDFSDRSDIDVLVAFHPESAWSLFDVMQAEEELSGLLGRKVDLINRLSIERSDNWVRRKEILGSAETVYVAR